MNRLKSIFISTFLTAVSIFFGISIFQFINDEDIILTGISIAIPGIIVLVFAKFFIFKSPRTSQNFPILSTVLILLYAGFVFKNYQNGMQAIDLLIFNSVSIFCWFVYLRWYSVFPDRNDEILKVGNQLPEIEFQNTVGEMISTNSFTGSKVIYMFYRGNWCPLCMAQIKEIAGQYQELANRGVKVALVSPQPHRHTKSLAKKFDVPFLFLRDIESKAAKLLHIFVKSGTPLGLEVLGYESDTVLPTVVICDENGKIIFADLTDNYRVRPEPETFLKVLEEAGK